MLLRFPRLHLSSLPLFSEAPLEHAFTIRDHSRLVVFISFFCLIISAHQLVYVYSASADLANYFSPRLTRSVPPYTVASIYTLSLSLLYFIPISLSSQHKHATLACLTHSYFTCARSAHVDSVRTSIRLTPTEVNMEIEDETNWKGFFSRELVEINTRPACESSPSNAPKYQALTRSS